MARGPTQTPAKIRHAKSSSLASKTSGWKPSPMLRSALRASVSISANTSIPGRRRSRPRVSDDPLMQKIRDGNPLTEDEEQVLAQHLNNPEMYFNEENLRRAYRRPGGTLIDFIRAALGDLKLKSRDEELTENFQAWLVSKNLTSTAGAVSVAAQEPWHRPWHNRGQRSLPAAAVDPECGWIGRGAVWRAGA